MQNYERICSLSEQLWIEQRQRGLAQLYYNNYERNSANEDWLSSLLEQLWKKQCQRGLAQLFIRTIIKGTAPTRTGPALY